jgi:hypothetical protein
VECVEAESALVVVKEKEEGYGWLLIKRFEDLVV